MVTAFAAHRPLAIKTMFAAGTHADARMPPEIEWLECPHPVPDARSVAAARRALDIAASVEENECLLILLSGGASAVMALPVEGITLQEKQESIQTMLHDGAGIDALNTVRKHLSAIKGGRLGAACRGRTVTLAVSDVIGDDVSVIGSGPGVADPSTWADALAALLQHGGSQHPAAVRDYLARGVRGEIPDTPKPGSPLLARTSAQVIASRPDAVRGAQAAAAAMGYNVIVLEGAVDGEARDAARIWFNRVRPLVEAEGRPMCVISAGETTVHVTGKGRGGRNQEFVLALVDQLAAESRDMVAASLGTDGIDGPTDAAGAVIDGSTASRARALGLSPAAFLGDNDAYRFFAHLGDLIHLGRTDTNVGDVQVLLAH